MHHHRQKCRAHGERHPKAKLTDREVDQLREMAEAGWSYGQLAVKFEISKSGVQRIVTCRTRALVSIDP